MSEEGQEWMEIDYDDREEWETESEGEEEEGYISKSEGEEEEEEEEEEEYIMESDEVPVEVLAGEFEGEEQQEGQDIMESEEVHVVVQVEGEGEDIIEPDTEGEEDVEEEAERLEEMKPPFVTSWMVPDGIIVHGIICIDDGIFRLMNQCQLDDCCICYKPSSTHGKHQICCLPCGHMYGLSCIKKFLLFSSSSGKCPKCKTLCSLQDAKLLYPQRLCVTDHQEGSSAAFFPFTEHGLLEFQKYEDSRKRDARLLQVADETHLNILETKRNDLEHRVEKLERQRVNLLQQAKELEERAESLRLADELRRRACPLEPRVKALRRRIDALERLVSALRWRMDALKQRSDAYESRVKFYRQMYKDHHEREEEIASKAKNKGEKGVEKVAEEKQMQKSGSFFQFL